jgi:hypothetical protein
MLFVAVGQNTGSRGGHDATTGARKRVRAVCPAATAAGERTAGTGLVTDARIGAAFSEGGDL